MFKAKLFLKLCFGILENIRDDFLDLLFKRTQPYENDEKLASAKLQKLGKGDGRWSLLTDHINNRSVVYSVGIGNNISFDLDLINRFGCEVHAFDPTSFSKQWLHKQKLPHKFFFHDHGLANYTGSANFALPQGHSVSFSMLEAIEGRHHHVAQVKKLSDIFSTLGHSKVDLLKIDIEGGEYEIIDDLVQSADSIGQLLIEFHDRLIGKELSKEALNKLQDAGYTIVAVSRRGLEYSFSGPSYPN